MPSDAELIQRVRRRDAAAFDEIAARHGGAIRRTLERIVRDQAAADDLLQEVLLRLWTRAEQYTGAGSVRGWLCRTATNLALNHLRRRRRDRHRPLESAAGSQGEPPGDDLEPDWLIDPDALGADRLADLAEQREVLRRLVEALPPSKREVFRLVREAEMDIGDVAERLGIPAGTVKSRLHYAVRQLREQWEDIQEHWENA